MISIIQGQIFEMSPTKVEILTSGGVGYDIHISLNTYSQISAEAGFGDAIRLHTVQIVREDAVMLYGFATKTERDMFNLLIKVSGIGAATARTVLSYMRETDVAAAISEGDVSAFKPVKGVGPKLAEKIIVELRDKVTDEMLPTPSYESDRKKEPAAAKENPMVNDAIDALVALGFTKKSVEGAVKMHAATCDTVEKLIKTVLKSSK